MNSCPAHIRDLNPGASSRRWWPSLFGSIVAIILISAGCARAPEPNETHPPTVSKTAHDTNSAQLPERVIVDITSTPGQRTLIGFNPGTPYPWPRGNWLSFNFRLTNAPSQIETYVYWQVINIYAENLYEITKQLGIKDIEMLILPITNYQSTMQEAGHPEKPVLVKSAYALVSDQRIPRDWFLYKPWNVRDKARQIKAAYPLSFRAAE